MVAQMLEYAANGLEYWSMDKLRQAASEIAQKSGKSLDEEIRRLKENKEADIEEFWNTVEANLRNHRVRLVFVTDSAPKELRRLVEFLNEEMQRVEVLAVEVKPSSCHPEGEARRISAFIIVMLKRCVNSAQRRISSSWFLC